MPAPARVRCRARPDDLRTRARQCRANVGREAASLTRVSAHAEGVAHRATRGRAGHQASDLVVWLFLYRSRPKSDYANSASGAFFGIFTDRQMRHRPARVRSRIAPSLAPYWHNGDRCFCLSCRPGFRCPPRLHPIKNRQPTLSCPGKRGFLSRRNPLFMSWRSSPGNCFVSLWVPVMASGCVI